jgi:hypothetical protein
MRDDPDTPPIPSEILHSIYAAVGELILKWAHAEQILDNMITIFFHGAGAKSERDLPVALSRKMRYLRKSLRTTPSLATFRETANNLLSETKKLSDIRHTVVHGALTEYDAATQTITFVKLKAVKDTHWVDPRLVKLDDLLGVGEEAGNLALHLGDLLKGLLEAFVPKDVLDKHRRGLGR